MFNKRLMAFIEHKYWITLTVITKLAGLVCAILAIMGIGFVLDTTLTQVQNSAFYIKNIGFILLAVLMRFLLSYLSQVFALNAMTGVKLRVRSEIFAKLVRLGDYKRSIATANALQLTTDGVEQIENYVSKFLPQFFYSLIAPFVLFGVLAPYNMSAAVALVIFVPLIPMSIVVIMKIAKKILAKYWGAYLGLGDGFLENLQGLTTLKIFRRDADKHKQINKSAENFRRITMKVLSMQLNSVTIMDIFAYGGAAAGIIVTIIGLNAGTIGFFGAFITVLLAAEFFLPLRLLGSFFHTSMNSMTAAKMIFDILDTPESDIGRAALPEAIDNITVSDMNFAYEEGSPMLKGVNATISHGQFVGVVGESGSGKSTFAGVISGGLNGYEGSIRYGNVELHDVAFATLAGRVIEVSHKGYVFKGTVEDNMRMAKPDATDAELTAALDKVGLWGFFQTNGGLGFAVQEKGGNLSGGQAQRLALARALLADRDVYIFDEAASNVDVESEEKIMEVITSLKGKKTIIVISHRLRNIVGADNILVFDKGVLTESGTHAELINKTGSYHGLYTTQESIENIGGKSNA